MKNLPLLRSLSPLIALSLASCAAAPPASKPALMPAPDTGYVAGSFSKPKGTAIAFVVVNTTTGSEYQLPFGEELAFDKSIQEEVVLTALPAGTYRVKRWDAYATPTKERSSTQELSGQALSVPFTVMHGSIRYLGNFQATTEINTDNYPVLHTRWKVRSTPITTQQARQALLAAHPNFSSSQFTCEFCTDSLPSQ